MRLYHVTHPDNLPSIMSDGLIPLIGERAASFGEDEPRVYLFPNIDSMNTALASWLGVAWEEQYGEEGECCSLIVDLPENFPIEYEGVGYEISTCETIPPEYISFFREE